MNTKYEIRMAAKGFVKENIKRVILYLIFCCIFGVLFILQSVQAEVVLYGAEVCAFLGIIFMADAFYKACKKHLRLTELKNQITFNLENLPECTSLMESDYQNLLRELFTEMKKQESAFLAESKDMVDYYTLWAHQIKTPITAMSLILQAEKGDTSTQMKLELFKIEKYVEMVLQYLRMGSMSSDLVLAEYDLGKIVKQAVKKYATVFIYNKITLQMQDINVNVLTDEKWLSFVLEQILSNALKYTKRGTINIYMAQNAEKTLVIEDNGIGISGEDLPRVFEQGFTGYNGRMDKKASGLGLYLCKKVMDNLSHRIRIESEEGKGTKVFLELYMKRMDPE
ncbi:sensor histidine kinase [Aminipila luticellarii]|uniref:histidine kinase n=1 Tax=Aminipila luticellarii TaxID=2507160 RepID=A0A410PXL2_9FIRM|nr:sensor histidine kinase [Aminipila luticellarii]QAT43683.1 HAMP domain-containing histidine kinase [Aminipila luticellarii]